MMWECISLLAIYDVGTYLTCVAIYDVGISLVAIYDVGTYPT